MKRRIIASLLTVFLFSTLGAAVATLYIKNTTTTLTRLISLHQIEDLRQHLVMSILTVQSDLYTVKTNLGRKLDAIATNVEQLRQTAQLCSSCHHSGEITRQITEIHSLIADYENGLSYYITVSADARQINKLKMEAASIGMDLLLKTENMSKQASAKLESKTQLAIRQIRRAWLVLAVTMILTFVLGLLVAANLTRIITRPIHALVNATRLISGGDLGRTISYQDKTEFGELASHFNTMSRSLKNGYEKLQDEISERKRAEQALRSSEIRFRALFEQAAIGVAQIETATGKFVKVNRRYCEILGYTEEEMMNASVQSITYSDDLASDRAYMSGLTEGKIRDFSIEKRYLHKSGRIIWVSVTVSALSMPGENPRYNITVVLDITERKRIEAELNESHARYRQLFKTAPVSTWEENYSGVKFFLDWIKARGVSDIRNYLENNPDELKKIFSKIQIVRVNQSALRLFRAKDESELLGPIDKLIVSETLPLFREQVIAIAEGKTSFQSETVQRTLDGRRIDIILHMEVMGEPSRMNRVLVSHTDITALKRAEWSLRRSKNFIATVLNSIDASIAIIDAKDYTMLGCNSFFLRELQAVEGDVIGKAHQDVICRYYSRINSEECPVAMTRRTGSQAVCEHVREDPTGMRRNIEITTFPVKDDENRIIQIVHMAQDITLRRQAEDARLREQELGRISAERQLVETQLRMLQAQIEPHFLFNTLAHIMSLIRTEPDSAAKMLQYFTETLRVSLLRTREETSTLSHEVDLLRNFLRIQAMRLEPRLQFTIDIPDDVSGLPFPPLLLQPLVENAVIHGIEPKVEGGSIAIMAEKTEDFLRLRVTDTGQGFISSHRNGVGLANVQERLHALYGKKARLILTENIPCGTTATLEVPL